MQSDLEPVVRPARPKLVALVRGLVSLTLGLLKGWLGAAGRGPHRERNVLGVIFTIGKVEFGQIDRCVVTTLESAISRQDSQ